MRIGEKMKIVDYQEQYSKGIVEHIKRIAMDEFAYYDWEDYFKRMDFEAYQKPGSKFWVVLNDEGEVIGSIGALRVSEKEVKMNSLYVDQKYRKMGIAKKLYELLLVFAKEQGYEKITLRTFFRFVNAIDFYEKMGFVKEKQDEESCDYVKNLAIEK